MFFSPPRLWTVESIWLLTQKEVSVFIRVRDEGKSCEYSHRCYFSFSTHLGAIFMSCNRIFSPGKSKLCESRLESLPSLLGKPRLTTDSLPWHSRGPSGWTSVRLCTLIPRYCPSCSPGPEEQHCWLLPKLSLCFSVSICSLFCLPSFLSSHPPHFYPLFKFKVKHCSFHKSGCRED